MEKEFNLSEKIVKVDRYGDDFSREAIPPKDVKEFIKQETWLLQAYIQEEITWEKMCEKRLKLIGDKLTGTSQDE